eukprot:jgi/Chrzof1/4251/Cz14g05010.t1
MVQLQRVRQSFSRQYLRAATESIMLESIASAKKKGYRVVSMSPFWYKGLIRYNVILENSAVGAEYFYALDIAAMQSKLTSLGAQGYNIISVAAYQGSSDAKDIKYAAVVELCQ